MGRRGLSDLHELAAQTDPGSGPHSELPLFEARGISKAFGEVQANSDVSLRVMAGEKHALLGENGAGKSTLVKMIDGVLQPDSGRFFWDGKPVALRSPAAARARGIGMVFQHFATFGALTAAENIALALPGRSLRSIRREMRETAAAYGLGIDPDRRVGGLSAGEKQRVEIVRCLMQAPKLLILDEPTSVLTPQEAEALFKTLDKLAASGVAIIYISHRLEEVRAFCDRATILRRGEVVATCDPRQETAASIAEMMIGETAASIEKPDSYVGGPRLEVTDLSLPAEEGVPLRKVGFQARRGEILGIAGVAGEGQDTLFAALSGEQLARRPRSIRIDGKPAGALGPNARRRLGAAFAPEQRLGHAAIAELPLSDNLRLSRLHRRGQGRGRLRERVAKLRETHDVRGASGDPPAGTLSGGNLQKFVIGREIDRDPGVFVAAQPTWGIDAGAAVAIRTELAALARRGAAVVVISQDLDEIFQICDRVAVIHRGELSETYPVSALTPEKIGLLMTGAELRRDLDAELPEAETAAPVGAGPRDADLKIVTNAPAPLASDEPVQPRTAEPSGSVSIGTTVTVPWTPPQAPLTPGRRS